jgi:hypothetical protein
MTLFLLRKNEDYKYQKVKIEIVKKKVFILDLDRKKKKTLINKLIRQFPMTTFKLPGKLCDQLDANKKDGNYMVQKAWDALCQPKKFGGLGFRRFKDFNEAVLLKIGLNIL